MIRLLRFLYFISSSFPLVLMSFEINDQILVDEFFGLTSIILYLKLNWKIDSKLKLSLPSPAILLFPLFFIFFHFDYILYDIINYPKVFFNNIRYYYSGTEDIFYLTNFCLFLIYAGRVIKRKTPYKNYKISKRNLLIIISLALPALTIISFPSLANLAAQQKYEGTDAGSVTSNALIHLLAFFCCFSLSTVVTIKPINKLLSTSLVAFVIANCILLSFIGDRNLLMLIIFSGAMSYGLSKTKKIKIFKLLFLGAILGILYVGFEQYRESKDTSISEIEIVSSTSAIGFLEAFSSFETTKALTRASLYIDTSKYDHFYGKYTMYGLFGVVPYLTGVLNPFFSDSESPKSSSPIFTNEVKINTQSRWGLGTSLIGDLFLDLSIYGAPLVFFLLGLNIGGYEKLFLNNNCKLFAIIQISVISAYYFQSARYGIGILVKPIFYLWLLRVIILRK